MEDVGYLLMMEDGASYHQDTVTKEKSKKMIGVVGDQKPGQVTPLI